MVGERWWSRRSGRGCARVGGEICAEWVGLCQCRCFFFRGLRPCCLGIVCELPRRMGTSRGDRPAGGQATCGPHTTGQSTVSLEAFASWKWHNYTASQTAPYNEVLRLSSHLRACRACYGFGRAGPRRLWLLGTAGRQLPTAQIERRVGSALILLERPPPITWVVDPPFARLSLVAEAGGRPAGSMRETLQRVVRGLSLWVSSYLVKGRAVLRGCPVASWRHLPVGRSTRGPA